MGNTKLPGPTERRLFRDWAHNNVPGKKGFQSKGANTGSGNDEISTGRAAAGKAPTAKQAAADAIAGETSRRLSSKEGASLEEALAGKHLRVGSRVEVDPNGNGKWEKWTVEYVTKRAVSLGSTYDTFDMGVNRYPRARVRLLQAGTGPKYKVPEPDVPTSLYD